LKLLRFDAGLSVAKPADCPAIGSDVLVAANVAALPQSPRVVSGTRREK
jgi:hypothetical protein